MELIQLNQKKKFTGKFYVEMPYPGYKKYPPPPQGPRGILSFKIPCPGVPWGISENNPPQDGVLTIYYMRVVVIRWEHQILFHVKHL